MAYYSRGCQSESLFKDLIISQSPSFKEHLNQYDVIYLNMQQFLIEADTGKVIEYLECEVLRELKELYGQYFDRKDIKFAAALREIFVKTEKQFIFLIDEWDCVMRERQESETIQKQYLDFLRNLLKDQPYVALAYMTGVLPIKRYSTSSALNMFQEYTMMNDPSFEKYFGFTEEEVEALCRQQTTLSMEEINEWYNGYQTRDGHRLYNPRSVVCALEDGICQSYWTTTGRMDEVLFFLKYNIGEVREDAIKMVNHMPVRIEIRKEYTAGQESPATKKEIYAAMIIYGLLSYSDDELRIPNKELMIEFENSLEDDDFGYVAELVRNSGAVLDATIARQGETVASYLHNIHNSELPILKYNDENSLSCVVTLAYLSARNKYNVEREEKSGKGFADFIFYPKRRNLPGIIIELKADSSPEAAILQIKNKEYSEKLRKKKVGSILAVGINYDSRKKEHQCLIEELL